MHFTILKCFLKQQQERVFERVLNVQFSELTSICYSVAKKKGIMRTFVSLFFIFFGRTVT